MWLTPLVSSQDLVDDYDQRCNAVYILFDEPLSIGHIKLWNYSKTPSRGVKELEVFMMKNFVDLDLINVSIVHRYLWMTS